MENNYYRWCVAIAIAIAFIVFGVVRLSGRTDEPANVLNGGSGIVQTSTSNVVAGHVTLDSASSSQQIVQSATGDYSFALPSTWYLERNDTSGVTIYPDYDPAGSAQPDCKIEIYRDAR